MLGDGRWRDLLPLPLFRPASPGSQQDSGGKNFESVSSKRNRVRREDNVSKVNEVIHAVNEMAGFTAPSKKPALKAQCAAQTVLMRSVASLPRCAERPRMREAIHELLRLSPSSEYMSEEVVRSTVHPYDPCLVSLPECGAAPCDATELIDERGRDVLERFEDTMIASDEALGSLFESQKHIKPDLDEVFQKEPSKYIAFIKDLYERGMIEFREHAKSIITPFFVTKKNGKLRLVLDCRASNQHFTPPPDIALAAGYTFGQLEVGANEVMYTAQSDVKDYFYSIGLPRGLRGYFCMPSIPIEDAKELCDLSGFGEVDRVYPCMQVVPMGWSWAMWLAQRVHQHQACIALDISPAQVLADGRPPPSMSSGEPVIIPYADNLNVCGIDSQRVQSAKDKVVQQLQSVGFRVHEEEDASAVVQALGFILDGQKGEVRPIPRKRDKLRLVLLWLSTRPKITGRALERVIGHSIHMFMLRRELLSVFRAVYDFKVAHYKKPVRLWASAAKECKWAAALLLVCKSDLRLPWCGDITVSDACLTGTAVATLHSDPSTARSVGQCREMWRFKSRDPLSRARDAVLKLDPFADVSSVKPLTTEKQDPFQINAEFQHVPESLACSDKWVTQFATRMQYSEHITLLEGRGSLQAIRHKLRTARNFGLKHLHLGDNLGMTLAYDRGRAKSIPLLMCCRRAAAYSVAANCTFTHRWLPSEWSAADGPSRRWESQAPKVKSKRMCKKVREGLCYPESKGQGIQHQVRQFIVGAFSAPEEGHPSAAHQGSAFEERAEAVHPREGRSDQGMQTQGLGREQGYW